MARKRDDRPVVYVVRVETHDWLFGDEVRFEVRELRHTHLNIPYLALRVESFEDGEHRAVEAGYRPVRLVELRRRLPKEEGGWFVYEAPQEVKAR
jgi:hypothetical protein